MRPPRLTFFVELPSDSLAVLFEQPGVMDFLVHGQHALAMGMLDLTAVRAALVRRLEGAGVPVTGWLLLDVAAGYWLNADNPQHARARYHETRDWAAREGLRLQRIGLDIEFPRADADLLMQEPRRGLLKLLRRRRTAEQVHAAERAYAALVEEIRTDERSVETYHFPHLLDERAAGSTLLRRTLGLVDVSADLEVYMLYASYFGHAATRAYFPDAPCIALGVTGGGVNADLPEEKRRRLSWERLEQDLLAARRHTDEIYVFSLEGCVEQAMLARLAALDWQRRLEDVSQAALRRAYHWRTLFRWVLRSEWLLDRMYPARPQCR